jgi:2',3'-cyclic-nucleotide 2'-phosphodiesterase (5'-nucleotidase family)
MPVSHKASLVRINTAQEADTSVLNYYTPYKDSLDQLMKIPVAELEYDLTRKQPESTLGNLMADILKQKTAAYSGKQVDVGIVNYGGIRVTSLTKGLLRVEDAYFIMPFDNYLVIQELSGQQLTDLCDSIALKKGWPVSGISFQIKDNRAVNILVNEQAISLTKKYSLALSDYVANGGDGMAFLKSIPQQQTGKLFRDAIIEFWREQSAAGKKITSVLENRISYAE